MTIDEVRMTGTQKIYRGLPAFARTGYGVAGADGRGFFASIIRVIRVIRGQIVPGLERAAPAMTNDE